MKDLNKTHQLEIIVDGVTQPIDPPTYGIDEILPYEPASYFHMPTGTIVVALSQLQPTRAREKGVRNAFLNMKEAREGLKEKRHPISITEMEAGRFAIRDGNSTFINALIAGWPDIPCRLGAEEN